MIVQYRAAVALNNMGVALLERGAYRQGMQTLKDSILIMKGILRHSGKGVRVQDTHKMMNMAAKRFMAPEITPTQIPVRVVAHDGSLQYAAMKDILSRGDFCAVLVRIEPVDLRSPDNQDTDLESAIILYNFAIAHICMAKHSNSSADVQQFHEGSLKLLEMTCDIAAEEENCADDMETNITKCTGELRLLLSAAALKNVIEVLADMGRIAEALEYHHQFLILGSSLDEMEAMLVCVGDTNSAPAA